MNERTEESQRSRWDFIQFSVIFFGFVLAAGGIITDSIRGALAGLFLMAVGLTYFLLRDSDSDSKI
jgi:hypothetical protein